MKCTVSTQQELTHSTSYNYQRADSLIRSALFYGLNIAKENTMIEKFTVEIEVGDVVEVGRMHLANQTIKAIEIDKWGHPVMVLESGRKRGLFNMRIKKLIPADVKRVQEPSDVMMTKEQWALAQAKIDEARSK
jgi:hypothetical protein